LGTVLDPAYELEEAVKIFEINHINYITVDFPALRFNVFKDRGKYLSTGSRRMVRNQSGDIS
jgi:hypothetical protein